MIFFSSHQITIRHLFCVTATLLITIITGCSSPVARLEQQAATAQLERIILSTDKMPLLAFHTSSNTNIMYVYLEGDGRPWDKGRWPAKDPNTRSSIALPLLITSPYSGIYLARPCYGWVVMPPQCHQDLWLAGRYSKEVVERLSQALDTYKQRHNTPIQWVLVGHSGGGTLAMLLAQQRKDVIGLITLAGNLDPLVWTRHFGYLPLSQSLNPARQTVLPKSIQRWHLLGEKDQVVPPKIMGNALSQDPLAKVIRFSDYDHRCCWQQQWQNIIADFHRQLIHSLQ